MRSWRTISASCWSLELCSKRSSPSHLFELALDITECGLLLFQLFVLRILGAQEAVAQEDRGNYREAQDSASGETSKTAKWATHAYSLVVVSGIGIVKFTISYLMQSQSKPWAILPAASGAVELKCS